LLVRAGGPALAALGVGGTLSDPTLTVYSGQTAVAANDNWADGRVERRLRRRRCLRLPIRRFQGCRRLQSGDARSGYTVKVAGVGGTTGTVIAELYDSTPSSQFTPSRPSGQRVRAQETSTPARFSPGICDGRFQRRSKFLVPRDRPDAGGGAFNIGGAMTDPKLDLFQPGKT